MNSSGIEEAWQATTHALIVYDRQLVPDAAIDWLEPDWWIDRKTVRGRLQGRGEPLVIDTPAGTAVLRPYLRGGLVARVSADRYVFTGFRRSRAMREWQVLSRLLELGMPVPRPLLAGWRRHGLTASGALMTRMITGTRSLAEVASDVDQAGWARLGTTLRGFFDAGLKHPDLNARNVLIDERECWWLVDFDRARLTNQPVKGRDMLNRLARSLAKVGFPEISDRLPELLAYKRSTASR